MNPRLRTTTLKRKRIHLMENNKEFAFDIIAQGSYIDQPFGDDARYIVEATTIRLNHIALNDWLMAQNNNCRECYVDGEIGDREWEEHKAEKAARYEKWKTTIIYGLGIELNLPGESISITQAQSEVFTVVRIWKVA